MKAVRLRVINDCSAKEHSTETLLFMQLPKANATAVSAATICSFLKPSILLKKTQVQAKSGVNDNV